MLTPNSLIPSAFQHEVDQGGHIVDVDILVIVHVTTQASVLRGEVARVARAAVDMGVGLVLRVGFVPGCALAAHQAGAVIKHISGAGHSRCAPITVHIDGPQVAAAIEHVTHISHLGRVELTHIKARQIKATRKHP